MSQSSRIRYEWNQLPWKHIQVKVFKLQRRIYRASQHGNAKAVHKLQRLLIKSWYARLLAVRRVTQENSGKKTAGIDGIKSLTPPQRLQLSQSLKNLPKPKPLRRVWIPKPGKPEKRPLSIPVIQDRAAQAVVKLALEPQWEAKFEPNVYGFRPGRSCQDAIEAIFKCISRKPKYVLEGDITGCFDNISHSALLDKSQTPPSIRRLIKGWLKCGVMDGSWQPTDRGTPQGGIVSPVLALIALHGLESHITTLGTQAYPIQAVFYADDFVVLAAREADIHRAKAAIEQWLKGIGLELHPRKTQISHTLEGQAGFEFLGFHVRQYRTGKYASKRGYKTLIKPSKASEKRHLKQLNDIIAAHKTATQAQLIYHLNPVITGWCNYYASVVSKQRFSVLAHRLFSRLLRWAKRRHPKLNYHQIVSRYWLVNQGNGWIFQTNDGVKLRQHREIPIRRHIKVRASKSPYDGDWAYWGTRRGYHPGMSSLKTSLLKRQRGKCCHCGLYFLSEDQIELHHIDGDHNNSRRSNLTLLHRPCHDQIHSVAARPPTGTLDTEPNWRGAV